MQNDPSETGATGSESLSDARPKPWGGEPSPDGFHFEATEDKGWIVPAIGGGRCRFVVAHSGRKACGRPAVATLMRPFGRSSPRPWDYCDNPEHLFGRWIEDGKVMSWRLVADEVA